MGTTVRRAISGADDNANLQPAAAIVRPMMAPATTDGIVGKAARH
jgi:hypothetical protein